jgi:hypothetical protein
LRRSGAEITDFSKTVRRGFLDFEGGELMQQTEPFRRSGAQCAPRRLEWPDSHEKTNRA